VRDRLCYNSRHICLVTYPCNKWEKHVFFFLESGFTGWSTSNWLGNLYPDYKEGYSWFTVFGVFFPTVTGVMAGINMSGDLAAPNKDIPNGSLAAVRMNFFFFFFLQDGGQLS